VPHSLASESNARRVDQRIDTSAGSAIVGMSHQSLIAELGKAIADRDVDSRTDVLRRVTDLFAAGSPHFDESQRSIFDDVMGRLVDELDGSARAKFGERLATIVNAPTGVSRALALDDSIAVAGPLLAQSNQLDDATLIVCAKTKSQQHLLAITRRIILTEGVTDVLVERGNGQVIQSAAKNSGARFSEHGYSALITRAEADEELALTIWSRPGIPRKYLLAMFARASEAVRLRLQAAYRGKAALIADMLEQASDEIQAQTRYRFPEFDKAHAEVNTLHQAGALTGKQVREFAEAGRFDALVVALSLLSDLPIGVIERILVYDHSDRVLVLARGVGLSWETAKAILLVQADLNSRSNVVLDLCFSRFNRLKPRAARTAIHFYRSSQSSGRNMAQNGADAEEA
jgi:uncharacterized protein (DUF2336 family)